jgi:hypothetical protein
VSSGDVAIVQDILEIKLKEANSEVAVNQATLPQSGIIRVRGEFPIPQVMYKAGFQRVSVDIDEAVVVVIPNGSGCGSETDLCIEAFLLGALSEHGSGRAVSCIQDSTCGAEQFPDSG